MAQVCSVMGEGLGLLPNRALSASVRRPSANDIFLPPRHRAYREYSARMMAIPSEYPPLIQDFDVQPILLLDQTAQFPKQVMPPTSRVGCIGGLP